jgi:hypothetical protein
VTDVAGRTKGNAKLLLLFAGRFGLLLGRFFLGHEEFLKRKPLRCTHKFHSRENIFAHRARGFGDAIIGFRRHARG